MVGNSFNSSSQQGSSTLGSVDRVLRHSDTSTRFGELVNYIHRIGLSIRQVPGDGNCLFHAISMQLHDNTTQSFSIRKIVCDYMADNKPLFQHYMEDNTNFDAYLEHMRMDKTWAGNAELAAASMVYNVTMEVHRSDDIGKPNIIDRSTATKTLRLGYHSSHYYSLHAVDASSAGSSLRGTNDSSSSNSSGSGGDGTSSCCCGCGQVVGTTNRHRCESGRPVFAAFCLVPGTENSETSNSMGTCRRCFTRSNSNSSSNSNSTGNNSNSNSNNDTNSSSNRSSSSRSSAQQYTTLSNPSVFPSVVPSSQIAESQGANSNSSDVPRQMTFSRAELQAAVSSGNSSSSSNGNTNSNGNSSNSNSNSSSSSSRSSTINNGSESMVSHVPGRVTYLCPVEGCDMRFACKVERSGPNTRSMVKHLNEYHSNNGVFTDELLARLDQPDCPILYHCTSCRKLFSSDRGLAGHIRASAPLCDHAQRGISESRRLQQTRAEPFSDAEVDDRMRVCGKPLWFLSSPWVQPMAEITATLLEGMADARAVDSTRIKAAQAFVFLPGLISALRGPQANDGAEKQGKIIDLLRLLLQRPTILPDAILWHVDQITAPPARLASSGQNRSNAMAQLKSAEAAMHRGQIRTGVSRLRTAQLLLPLHGEADPSNNSCPSVFEPLTQQALAEKVQAAQKPIADARVMPDLPEHFQPYTVGMDAVYAVIKRMSANSSQGADGWTPIVWKMLFTRASTALRTRMAEATHKMANALLAGALPPSLRYILCRVRVAPVPKFDPETGHQKDWRLVNIFSVPVRMFRRIMLSTISRIGPKLFKQSHQMGCGVKGGAAILSRATQAHFDNKHPGVSLDAAQAFPSIWRHETALAVLREIPGYYAAFLYFDFPPHRLYDQAGNLLGEAVEGSLQGDAFAGPLFDITTSPALSASAQELTRLEVEISGGAPTGGTIGAFVDDIRLMPQYIAVVPDMLRFMQRQYAKVGIGFQLDKNGLVWSEAEVEEWADVREELVAMGWNPECISDEGGMTLGIPYGRAYFVESMLWKRYNRKSLPLEALAAIPLRLSLPILRISLCRIWSYHAAAMEDPQHARVLQAFDEDVARAAATLVGYQRGPVQDVLIRLPWGMSGLGILQVGGMHHEGLLLTTRKLITESTEEVPALRRILRDHIEGLPRVVHGRAQGLADVATVSVADIQEQGYHALTKTIKNAQAKGYQELCDRVLQGMRQDRAPGAPASMAFVAGGVGWAGKSTRAFMGSGMLSFSASYFSDSSFRAVARCAIGLHPLGPPATSGHKLRCPCRHSTCLYYDWGHILACHGLTYLRTERHDALVGHLATFLRKMRPQARVTLNPSLHAPSAPHSMSDLKFEDGNRTYVIDLTCSNPMSHSAIEHTRLSSVYYPDAASQASQALKEAHYNRALAHSPATQANSVAFVVDVHGRIGANARAFLATVGAHDPGEVAGLIKSLAQTASVYAGRMLAEMLHRPTVDVAFAGRTANPDIPPPPDDYDRWDEAGSRRRGRRPRAPSQANPNAVFPPSPHHPSHPPPIPHHPHPQHAHYSAHNPINPPPYVSSPPSPLGRDDPSPRRQWQRPAPDTPGTQDTQQRQQHNWEEEGAPQEEVQHDQDRLAASAGSPQFLELEGPTGSATPPTPPPTPPGGQSAPALLDVDALLANPNGDLVMRQSRALKPRFGLGGAAGAVWRGRPPPANLVQKVASVRYQMTGKARRLLATGSSTRSVVSSSTQSGVSSSTRVGSVGTSVLSSSSNTQNPSARPPTTREGRGR